MRYLYAWDSEEVNETDTADNLVCGACDFRWYALWDDLAIHMCPQCGTSEQVQLDYPEYRGGAA